MIPSQSARSLAGARSFLVPYVQNAEEARRAVAATRYPPAGIRGYSGMHRGNEWGRDKGYPQTAADDIFLAVQLYQTLIVQQSYNNLVRRGINY